MSTLARGAAVMSERVTAARFFRLTGRALLLRCPRCGSGGLLAGWFRLRHECPTCGLLLDRGEPDYWIGGYAVNFVAAELLVAGILVAVVLASWPAVPWGLVQYGGVTLAILVPILFFPFSRVLWLAWDFMFRPNRD